MRRQELVQKRTMEPVTLLAAGGDELERGGWNFAIAVTEADLRTYYRESAKNTSVTSLMWTR